MDKVMYIDMEVTEEEQIEIEINEGGSGNRLPYYTGPYEVVPEVDKKVLETKDKSMAEDVVVLEIPKYQFDNTAKGQTVVIGGKL